MRRLLHAVKQPTERANLVAHMGDVLWYARQW
jgi:hypothetical protein